MIQHPLISTNTPTQNDILRIKITYPTAHIRLITLYLTGFITYTDQNTQFLESVPIVLKINEKISGIDEIDQYLPKNILPSYHSDNFNISYYINLKFIDQHSDYVVKKEFGVINRYLQYVDISQMIVLEQEMCRVRGCKPIKEYYDLMKDLTVDINYVESDKTQKLGMIDKKIKDSLFLEKYKNIRYTHCIESLIVDAPPLIEPRLRKFFIKIETTKIVEIHISDTFYTNRINYVRIRYLKEISNTSIKIKQQEKEVLRQIEFDKNIFEREFCSEKCVDVEVDVFLESRDVFSIECFVFLTRFVVVLGLDSNEIEVPVIVAK